jgi:2-dehydropantoate 2-reductase
MSKMIAVLGTGSNGSCIGADLTQSGHDVTLIDQWPAHVEAMRTRGLRIFMTGSGEEMRVPVKAMHLCEVCTLPQQFDIVFLVAKSYDTCWMVHFIKPYLKPEGVLVSLQNSLNDEWIAPIIGYQRDIASVVELASNMFEPGFVKRSTDHAHTWVAVGELHGRVTPRLQEVAEILRATGKTEVTSNIWGAKWTKLAVNCMGMALCGILGIYDWEISQDPQLVEISIKLGKECVEVGRVMGYTLEPIFGLGADDFLGPADDVLKRNLISLLSAIGKEAVNCIRQDQMKGRRSEVEFLNGLVVKKGKEAKVPTPWNEAVTSLTHQIETGILRPDRSNLGALGKCARSTGS